jgi:GMP synthase (glutamine-hydrolysing)
VLLDQVLGLLLGDAVLLGKVVDSYDAPAIHTDEVETLPQDAVLLATNRLTEAEIRHGDGVFWGVQYHPEIGLDEVAGAIRRQSGDLIKVGLARSHEDIERYAPRSRLFTKTRSAMTSRGGSVWTRRSRDPERRRREMRNFIERLVKPRQNARCRG